MSFSPRARYLLITAAVLTAGVIQLVRGYRPLIVIIGVLAFAAMGNLLVYVSGAKERAMRRDRKRQYWAS